MERLKKGWYRTPRAVRRILVATVGGALLIVGMILWFLPGPGWGTIILGLVILSTEFTWANRLKEFIISKFKGAAQAVKERSNRK